MTAFYLPDLRARGFRGFVRVRDLYLNRRLPLSTPGVYVVVRESPAPPSFLPVSPASWFKGRDPSVPIALLEQEWVPDAHSLYIGSGCDLQDRIGLLLDFSKAGRVRSVFHWGGRLLWQLADSDDLVVGWREEPRGRSSEERDLTDEFSRSYGRLPFANLKRPPVRNCP